MSKPLLLLLGPSALPGATSASEIHLTLQAEALAVPQDDWEIVEAPFRWWDGLEAARTAILARAPAAVLLVATDPDAALVRVSAGARNRAGTEKDAAGHGWPGRQIAPGGKSQLVASLPSDGLLAAVRASGAPAEMVGHPGLGVTNRCFYGLLAASGSAMIGCLHLPMSLESARRHASATPSRLNRATLLNAVLAALAFAQSLSGADLGGLEPARPAAR